LVHIESTDNDIENLHPMSLDKSLSRDLSSIINIRKIGKNIIDQF